MNKDRRRSLLIGWNCPLSKDERRIARWLMDDDSKTKDELELLMKKNLTLVITRMLAKGLIIKVEDNRFRLSKSVTYQE